MPNWGHEKKHPYRDFFLGLASSLAQIGGQLGAQAILNKQQGDTQKELTQQKLEARDYSEEKENDRFDDRLRRGEMQNRINELRGSDVEAAKYGEENIGGEAAKFAMIPGKAFRSKDWMPGGKNYPEQTVREPGPGDINPEDKMPTISRMEDPQLWPKTPISTQAPNSEEQTPEGYGQSHTEKMAEIAKASRFWPSPVKADPRLDFLREQEAGKTSRLGKQLSGRQRAISETEAGKNARMSVQHEYGSGQARGKVQAGALLDPTTKIMSGEKGIEKAVGTIPFRAAQETMGQLTGLISNKPTAKTAEGPKATPPGSKIIPKAKWQAVQQQDPRNFPAFMADALAKGYKFEQ